MLFSAASQGVWTTFFSHSMSFEVVGGRDARLDMVLAPPKRTPRATDRFAQVWARRLVNNKVNSPAIFSGFGPGR